MNLFRTLIKTMSGAAIDVLADFDKQLALDAGMDPNRVREWEGLHAVYFGKTSSRQKQRIAREKAQRKGFSLDQLVLIERRIKKVASNRTRTKLRLMLLDATGNYKALARLARKIVPGTVKPPRKQVTFTRSKAGCRTMAVTASDRDMSDLEHALMTGVDTTKPVAPQMLVNFLRLMRGYHAEGSPPEESAHGVPYAVPRPLLLIPLPDWVKIHQGTGDETILQLTDGTSITGAEFLNQHYATAENHLEAATFHPEEGAVNLYRGRRLANEKQRVLARATSPVCPVPDCRHSADACEIHHITAWKHGGETNIANLAPLCRYHNRVNDDDPGRSKRGRIVNVAGTPTWRSPRGRIVPNTHGAMHTLFA